MPRKNRDTEIAAKVEEYKKIYQADTPNDIASITQVVNLELSIAKLQKELLATPASDTKKIKDLNSALRDSTNSFNQLCSELDISRKSRGLSDEKVSVLTFIDKLKDQADKTGESRSLDVICSVCSQKLGSLYIAVKAIGAELGSIEAEKHPPQEMDYFVSIQCWKCAGGAPVEDTDGKWKQAKPTNSFGTIGTQDVVLLDRKSYEQLKEQADARE